MDELKPDSATTVRPGEELDLAALNEYLNDTVSDFGLITDYGQFPGGYSNLTYLLKTGSSTQEYVLRRPPFGGTAIKGGHDMGREFRVLSLLQSAGYPNIPEPVVFCDNDAVLGASFYVMKRIPGLILRAHTAPKMNLSPEILRRTSKSLVANLVQLHALDIQKTGLIQLGKPEGYVRRQVEGWHRRYLTAQTDDLTDMKILANWLLENLPPDNAPTLLHNDYKYDNVVLNPDNLSDIRAVLDWEMCTVGDPLMDVGTTLSYWAEPGDGAFEKSFNLTWLPGNLTRREFADRYAEASGRDLSNILYYYIFGLFKNAVVIQQIYTRYQQGLTQDQRFSGLLSGVRALARKGMKSMEHNNM